MSSALPEGFYWVRWADSDRGESPFVAQRFGQTWFVPGESETCHGGKLELLSGALTPPEAATARGRASRAR